MRAWGLSGVLFLCFACGDATSTVDSGTAAPSIGAACTSDSECEGLNAVCLTTSSQWGAFAGGYCSRTSCTFGEACTSDSACDPNPGFGPHCFANCTSDADCRVSDGYTCQTHPFSTRTYCLPAPDAG